MVICYFPMFLACFGFCLPSKCQNCLHEDYLEHAFVSYALVYDIRAFFGQLFVFIPNFSLGLTSLFNTLTLEDHHIVFVFVLEISGG